MGPGLAARAAGEQIEDPRGRSPRVQEAVRIQAFQDASATLGYLARTLADPLLPRMRGAGDRGKLRHLEPSLWRRPGPGGGARRARAGRHRATRRMPAAGPQAAAEDADTDEGR